MRVHSDKTKESSTEATGAATVIEPETSGVTSKPASRGHLKTGQLSASRTTCFYPTCDRSGKFFFRGANPLYKGSSVYTDLTWAEGTATQGCDRSTDPAAGMAGRRQPPQKNEPFWRESGKSQGHGDRVPI